MHLQKYKKIHAIIQLYIEKINCNKRPKKDVVNLIADYQVQLTDVQNTKITASLRLFH